MAGRAFYRDQGSLDRGIIDLYARIAIGATGAPTLQDYDYANPDAYVTAGSGDVLGGRGVAKISRTSAGLYVVTLQDPYYCLTTLEVMIETPATVNGGLTTLYGATLTASAVNTAGGGTVTFQCSGPTTPGGGGNPTPVAADPANGEFLRLHFALHNAQGP